jgi:hypothetical protein
MSRALRIFFLLVAAVLLVFAFRFAHAASQSISFGILGYGLLSLGCCIGAGICVAPGLIGLITRPFTTFFGEFFYPEERLTAPPESLLRALHMRVLDRQFPAVVQQLEALSEAYGPRPELFHLAAHLAAARGEPVEPVTAEAARRLKPRALETYLALLRGHPPRPAPASA